MKKKQSKSEKAKPRKSTAKNSKVTSTQSQGNKCKPKTKKTRKVPKIIATNLPEYLSNFQMCIEDENGHDLPLYHICSFKEFQRSCQHNEIQVKPCDVFSGEHLIYTFYGAAKFKSNQIKSFESSNEYPCCFILDIKECPAFERAYPFDTGWYHQVRGNQKNVKTISWDTAKEEMQIGTTIKFIKRMILTTYISLEHYIESKLEELEDQNTGLIYRGKYNLENPIPAFGDYHRILDFGYQGDERKGFIEIQFNKNILLNENSVLGIILRSDILRKAKTSDHAEIVKYNNCRRYILPRGISETSEYEITKIIDTKSKLFSKKILKTYE